MDSEALATQNPLNFGDGSEGVTGTSSFEACGCTQANPENSPLTDHLMEQIIELDNLRTAYTRVVSNKGACGVDGMTVEDLYAWCRDHIGELIESLMNGQYRPSPVRGVQIPKSGGGKRQLGIPTAVDRMVQQSILQVLTPIFEQEFSDLSYGFRPGRSAHQAIDKANEYVKDGYVYVVDMDLEKFFDRVNHDVLMSRVARYIKDKRLLKLLRAFLNAGLMQNGVVCPRKEGTPQGGPLSPLLANILLTDFDRELEKRGHRFVRYADDCNIYVQSPRAGERVFDSATRFLQEKLKLKVNKENSAVGHVSERSFLGYRLFRRREPWIVLQEYLPF
ncbi:MAG: group II intron reverse transcriptase/maturase [Spirochaetales bacterium]|jgi:RNA-directed DNA polymerase|nr:group II intron reverse transcriptase/maturase [Spirochaetales bacterium]